MPIIKFLGFGERKIGPPNVSSSKLEPLEKVFRIGGGSLFGLGGPGINLNILISRLFKSMPKFCQQIKYK